MNEVTISGRRLTVAHFMPWSGVGGVEVATLRMATLTEGTVRNVAFCLPDATELRSSFAELGIEVVTYSAPEPSLRHGLRYLRDSRIIAAKLRAVHADIVHFSDQKAAYHNSLAALLAGCKMVCHIRSCYPHLSLRQRMCLRPVDLFLFVSKEAMRSMPQKVTAKRARVIYDACEPPEEDLEELRLGARNELQIPDEATVVGMVSRVAPVKDYFTLANAAAGVLREYPNTRFLIVGDNSMVDLNRLHYAKVEDRLADLGISGSFVFTGHRSDVARFIAAMDICVLCSHREGLPLSILEAMAMRKPVVATAVGGIPELVRHDVTGYLHPHEDAAGLATAIRDLLADPAKAERFGQAGHADVRENHSAGKFVAEITAAYRDVIGGRIPLTARHDISHPASPVD